jgi:hypothetical protein
MEDVAGLDDGADHVIAGLIRHGPNGNTVFRSVGNGLRPTRFLATDHDVPTVPRSQNPGQGVSLKWFVSRNMGQHGEVVSHLDRSCQVSKCGTSLKNRQSTSGLASRDAGNIEGCRSVLN